ncbi:MAG: PQQ-dependent sugar dehydrogenase [Vicinamibacterales bacterium]
MPLRSRSLVLLSWLLTLLICDLSDAATVPTGFTDTPIASGLNKPTAMALATDGRLFVCEQGGALRVIKNNTLLPAPFVSLTVSSVGERGLLGVAFDPNFALNGFVYVYYTALTPTIHNRVSRFTAAGDIAVAGSETILLDLETLSATNHNGGAIHFGQDGKLYVGVGENAVGSNAQSLNNRLGKMLRINADGSIPPDNPFFTTATGANRAIWALGLRNPFTFAFQPASATLFINDVGEQSWEEINLGVAGANYGWPTTEGETTDTRFRSPLYAYGHSEGCAIAGGAFHSPLTPQFPFQYWGAYFFADLCSGWIRARKPDGAVIDFATGISSPVDIIVAAGGSLYYLARGTGTTTGIVSRVTYTLAAPRVNITANGSDGPVTLSATDSLRLDLSFTTSGGPLSAAEVYIGLSTPTGVLWVDPAQGFTSALKRVHVGALGSFSLSPWLNLSPGALPVGGYTWFVLIDDDTDGIPVGDMSDFVVTMIN